MLHLQLRRWYKIFRNRLIWLFVWRLQLFIQWESEAEEATSLSSGFLTALYYPGVQNPSETSMQEVCEMEQRALGLRGGCKAALRSCWWLSLFAVRCWGGCRERNGKRVLPKCSGAVLLPCTLNVTCPGLTPTSLCCSLLDSVAHTLHIQYVAAFFFLATAAVFVFITAKHTQMQSP